MCAHHFNSDPNPSLIMALRHFHVTAFAGTRLTCGNGLSSGPFHIRPRSTVLPTHHGGYAAEPLRPS
jgi:hypothetical protein